MRYGYDERIKNERCDITIRIGFGLSQIDVPVNKKILLENCEKFKSADWEIGKGGENIFFLRSIIKTDFKAEIFKNIWELIYHGYTLITSETAPEISKAAKSLLIPAEYRKVQAGCNELVCRVCSRTFFKSSTNFILGKSKELSLMRHLIDRLHQTEQKYEQILQELRVKENDLMAVRFSIGREVDKIEGMSGNTHGQNANMQLGDPQSGVTKPTTSVKNRFGGDGIRAGGYGNDILTSPNRAMSAGYQATFPASRNGGPAMTGTKNNDRQPSEGFDKNQSNGIEGEMEGVDNHTAVAAEDQKMESGDMRKAIERRRRNISLNSNNNAMIEKKSLGTEELAKDTEANHLTDEQRMGKREVRLQDSDKVSTDNADGDSSRNQQPAFTNRCKEPKAVVEGVKGVSDSKGEEGITENSVEAGNRENRRDRKAVKKYSSDEVNLIKPEGNTDEMENIAAGSAEKSVKKSDKLVEGGSKDRRDSKRITFRLPASWTTTRKEQTQETSTEDGVNKEGESGSVKNEKINFVEETNDDKEGAVESNKNGRIDGDGAMEGRKRESGGGIRTASKEIVRGDHSVDSSLSQYDESEVDEDEEIDERFSLSEQADEIDRLNEEYSQMKQQNEQLEKKVEQINKINQSELSTLQHLLQDLTQRRNELEERVNDLEKELDSVPKESKNIATMANETQPLSERLIEYFSDRLSMFDFPLQQQTILFLSKTRTEDETNGMVFELAMSVLKLHSQRTWFLIGTTADKLERPQQTSIEFKVTNADAFIRQSVWISGFRMEENWSNIEAFGVITLHSKQTSCELVYHINRTNETILLVRPMELTKGVVYRITVEFRGITDSKWRRYESFDGRIENTKIVPSILSNGSRMGTFISAIDFMILTNADTKNDNKN